MVWTLTGPNDFARSGELRRIVDAFVGEHGDMTVERIDAVTTDYGRLLEAVSAQPFLADRRLVIVLNSTSSKDISDNIEQLLDSVSDTTDMVLEVPKFDKRSLLYKTLKKRTEYVVFTDLDEQQLAKWLVVEAKQREGELKQNDARAIVDRAGTNQLALHHELNKLLSYDTKITREAIELLVEPLPVGTTFQLLDAAFSGNHPKTLELYKSQRLQQVEPQAIMGLVAWQVHTLAVVKANDTKSTDEISRSAKLNPFVVRKSQQLVRSKSQQEISQLVSAATRLDARLKSEMIDADDAVQHFLLTI